MSPKADYSGKNVLITGSRRGVGKLITDHFLDCGATVIGIARGESTHEHENYRHFQVDVGDARAVQMTFGAIRKEFKHLHIVVNNAGVMTSQYAMILPAQAVQEMVQTNVVGTFLVTRESAKLMRKTKWGRIINIGSMAARLNPMGDSVYAASKAAVCTLANVMAREFASMNVTCNTLGVSAIESDMLAQHERATIDEVIEALPLPRYAEPDDILNVVDFFASERSGYITAQTIYLAGV